MLSRFRQAFIAVNAVVMFLGVGAAAAAADQPALTIDQRKVFWPLDDVVSQVHDACEHRTDQTLTVHVLEPGYEFSTAIVCSAALAFRDKFIRRPLLEQAATHRHAGERANAVDDLQEALPPNDGVGYDHDNMVWAIAGSNGIACRRARSQKQIQAQMSASAQNGNHETPEHWTLVEAVYLSGVCPDRLPDLYRNVAALGNPIAAKAVEEIIERKPVTLPLKSVPQGISERSVSGRPVFLERKGNRVTTFLTNVHHLTNETTLWWCPKEKVFVSPTHAEAFDAGGTIVGGPAQRGLDRFKTTSRDGTVTVYLSDIVHGTTQRNDLPRLATAADSGAPWNTSPDSFCFQPLKSA